MALTFALKQSPRVPGAERFTVNEVTLDASYPTNGYTITPAQLGLTNVTFTVDSIKTASAGVCANAFYDQSTGKLKCYTTTAEIANATDLSAIIVQITAFGS